MFNLNRKIYSSLLGADKLRFEEIEAKQAVLALGRTGIKNGVKNPYFYSAGELTGLFPIGIGDFYAGIKSNGILDFCNYNFDFVFNLFKVNDNKVAFHPLASALLVDVGLNGGLIFIKRKQKILPIDLKAVYIDAQDILIYPSIPSNGLTLGFMQPPFDYHCSAELRQILWRVQLIKHNPVPITIHIIHESGESVIYAGSTSVTGDKLPARMRAFILENNTSFKYLTRHIFKV